MGAPSSGPASARADATVRLDELVDRAMSSHPRALGAVERVRAARRRADASGYWPDPTLMVMANNLPLTTAIDRSPMTGLQFRLQQTIPWPGKVDQREQVSRAKAEVAEVGPRTARLDLAREVGLAFFRVHLLDVTAQVLEENERILSTVIEVADAKYRVGRRMQQDILRARLSRDELRQQRLETKRRRVAAALVLAELTDEESGSTVPSLADIPIARLKDGMNESALLTLGESHSAELDEARRRQAERAASVALTDLEAWPDLQVGVAYTVRGDARGRDPADGSDFVSVLFGVQLPVHALRRRTSAVAAVVAEQAGARADEASVRRRMRQRVSSTIAQLPLLQKRMALLRDETIPVTRQTLQAERAAYQVDRGDMVELLQTELTLVGRLVEFHRLHVEQEILLVELARVLGVPRRELVELAPHDGMHGGVH